MAKCGISYHNTIHFHLLKNAPGWDFPYKHLKVYAIHKALKQDKEDQAKDLNKVKVALKSSEKEVKQITYKFEKKVATLEERINDFKSSKLLEEKALIKKCGKKLKIIQLEEN